MIQSWLANQRFKRQYKQFTVSSLAKEYSPPVIENQLFLEAEFFVLDFETTGLNPKTDRVLSVGFTTISKGRIQMSESAHYAIRHTKQIPAETVAIHHITEQEAARGQPIETIFPALLNMMSGKILVAHFADIEVGFLNQIAQKLYGTSIPLHVIDTLQIAYTMKYKDAVHIPSDALNLFSLREDYQLPRYKAHNAMIDAVSTAELLLAQASEIGDDLTVKRLLSMRR